MYSFTEVFKKHGASYYETTGGLKVWVSGLAPDNLRVPDVTHHKLEETYICYDVEKGLIALPKRVLINLWVDPIIFEHWDELASWHNFVGFGQRGSCWAYHKKPTKTSDGYISDGEAHTYCKIPEKYWPSEKSDQLIVRPGFKGVGVAD